MSEPYSNQENFEVQPRYEELWSLIQDRQRLKACRVYRGGCVNDRKSTSGYVFLLGSRAISWSSNKQATTTLSSTEAKYIAVTSATCEAVWRRRMLGDLD